MGLSVRLGSHLPGNPGQLLQTLRSLFSYGDSLEGPSHCVVISPGSSLFLFRSGSPSQSKMIIGAAAIASRIRQLG